MSNYVCSDNNRTKYIYAEECDSSNLKIEYFCPTPGCSAKLTLRSLNGENNPYFSALKSHPHNPELCTINKLPTLNFNNCNLSDFSFETFYDSIINCSDVSKISNIDTSTTNKNSNTNIINTTAKLYYYCKKFDINHNLNKDLMVKDIIADNRNNFIFTKRIYGLKLIESKFHRYDYDKNKLELKYPIDENCSNKYLLKIYFKDTKKFNAILKKIFNDKSNFNTVIIGILANFKFSEFFDNKVLSCSIESSKQIIII